MALTKKSFILAVSLLVMMLHSCTDKEPSILKVYVRSSDYILTEGALVRLVGDISKGTPEFYDEKRSNDAGTVIFNLDELFDFYGKDDEKVAYFNVYAKDTTNTFTISKARAKANLTSTHTIVLED